jgi:hypothetical protein
MNLLREEIEQELVQIAELVAKAERLLHLAKQTDDPDYLAGFIKATDRGKVIHKLIEARLKGEVWECPLTH